MKNKVVVLTIIFIVFLISYFCINPIKIYQKEEKSIYERMSHNVGDTIKLLEPLNFEQDEWCAYLILHRYNKNLTDELPSGTILRTKNINLLNQMKKDWVFQYKGGDMATVEDRIIFYKNGIPVFSSAIILDKEFEGFQSGYFGFLEPKEHKMLSKYCKQFKRVYSPIVFL